MKTIFFTAILLVISIANSYAQDSSVTPSMMEKINNELKLKRTYKEKTDYLKYLIENIDGGDRTIGEYSATGEDSTLYQAAQNLISLAGLKQDTTNIVIGLHGLAEFYSWNNYHDKSKNACKKVLKILKNKKKTAKENEILGSTYTYLAYAYDNSLDYGDALESCLLGNEILTNPNNHIENKTAIASNYLILSNIYSNIGREQEAFDNIKNVLKVYEQDKTLTYFGFTGNISMGSYFIDFKKDIDKALYHYDQAKKIGEEINDEMMVMDAENFKAEAFYNCKQYDKALELCNINLDFQKKNKDTTAIIYQYHYISKVFNGKKNNNEALKYIDSALFLLNSKTIYLPSEQLSILLLKAKIYTENKDYDKALVLLNENLALAESENILELEKQINESIYGIYNILNDDKRCVFYYNQYENVDAELQAKSEKSEIKILEADFKYREIKSKLENEKVMLQLSVLKQKKIKMYSYFALTLMVISAFFIYIIKDRQKKRLNAERLVLEAKQELLEVKKEALNREVEFKDKNITNFALQINDNNELLEKIKAPLKQLKKVVSGNNKHEKMLFEINSLVNGYIDRNNEKTQFLSKVNENVDNFELKIHEEYSNLTEKEKEIIKKIRLGKTSKEIASELNIGSASVDNYRYAVRKKMKIPKGKSLEHFIKEI